ncbi:ethanolamine utilization protein EutQ [Lactobacillus sp.] [Lactiplantibacillus mudanjiangensis]|uniref:SGNH/GDSL hydrolase family protein n=1 Tax=Lactiplantibacillus mudanjiangensis TaxID=1296538 RepID=UPI00101473FC|nr:SGNH/GDSL hydrolase family protein [Lactiplantibacillus mudanjiangensis]VDG30770.1 ethanolamine utilization protein EutQ [Lactobacillus sp.] [Lactiplantibacillus mudanjiangensis]
MHKLWETLKIVVIVAIIAGGVFWGLNHVLHPSSSSESTSSSKTASQTTKTSHKQKISLVAVGDSLTEGVGDETEGGYVGQIKDILTKKQNLKVSTTNAGKSGDRSDQILARINKSKTLQKKIAAADVLTVTVGGNDLLQTLEGALTSNNTAKNNTTVAKAQTTYAAKLTKLFNKLRQLNPNASMFVFSIYNPIYVNFPNVTAISKYVSQWNDQTQTTLGNYKKAYFMDINTVMSHGQYRTATQIAKLKKASNSTSLTNLSSASQITAAVGAESKDNNLISNSDNFHPNKKGYHIFSTKLYHTMMAHDSWLLKK